MKGLPRMLSRLLTSTRLFRLDGGVSLVFGLVTAFFQTQVFSTAVDLSSAGVTGTGTSLMEATLLTLSGYYALVGAALLVLARLPSSWAMRLSVLVLLHHAFMAAKDVVQLDRPWRTGNPWFDIVIHVTFVAAYLGWLGLRRRAAGDPAAGRGDELDQP